MLPSANYLKKTGIIGTVVLGLAGVVAWYSGVGSTPEQPVATATVIRQTIEESVLAIGVLQPIRKVDVGSQASGQLKTLLVHPGDQVEKGQLVAEIDSTLSKNALMDAEVALGSLAAQKLSAAAQVKRAQLALRRNQTMALENAVASQSVELAQADLQAQQAQLAVVDAQIHQQHIQVSTAQANLGYTRILAPVSGTVVSVSTQEGQTVAASYQVPVILQIADLSIMTVRTQVPEADIDRMRVGLPACFTTLSGTRTRYCSALRTLEPAPEKINNALFFNALFDVANPTAALRPDMTAQVSIQIAKADDTLVIPLIALGSAGADGRYQVRVLTPEGKTEIRQVKTGLDNAFSIQVLDGLKEGEQVIVASDDLPRTP